MTAPSPAAPETLPTYRFVFDEREMVVQYRRELAASGSDGIIAETTTRPDGSLSSLRIEHRDGRIVVLTRI